jgi:hypothetical protein
MEPELQAGREIEPTMPKRLPDFSIPPLTT